jgi:hypothetical protein
MATKLKEKIRELVLDNALTQTFPLLSEIRYEQRCWGLEMDYQCTLTKAKHLI